MSTGIIFGLAAFALWGIENSLAPAAIRKIGPIPAIFWRYFWEAVVFIPIFLYFYSTFHFDWLYFFITIICAFIGYIPVVTFFKALKIGKAGIVAPISNSSTIITVLLSIIFFQEKLELPQILAIVLIILGVMLISINLSDIKSSAVFDKNSGIGLALITCLLWGLVFFLFKIPVNILGPILTAIVLETTTGIYSGLHLALTPKNRNYTLDKKTFLITFFMGLVGALAIIMYNYGIQNYNVSLVIPIAMANPIITVACGQIFYQEKLNAQQITAVAMIIGGIVLISA